MLIIFPMPPYDQCVLFGAGILTFYLKINLGCNYLLYDFKVRLILENYTMAPRDYTYLSSNLGMSPIKTTILMHKIENTFFDWHTINTYKRETENFLSYARLLRVQLYTLSETRSEGQVFSSKFFSR